jgi:hypothetical protein
VYDVCWAQENRGYEGLAITPDGTTLYAMLQVIPTARKLYIRLLTGNPAN